jgi:hypothetical protein
MRAPSWLVAGAAITLLSCSNAGQDLGFDELGTGTVAAFIYLDRNGDLNPTAGGVDTAFGGVRLGLVVPGTPDTVFSDVTDANGNVVFSNVPFGSYRFVVDEASVADSMEVQAIDSANIQLSGDAQQQLVIIRLGFPFLTVAEARVAAAGRRVFVTAQVLAGLGVFGDTTAHAIGNGVAIRLTNGTHTGISSQPGDSVRVLGTVSVRAGQPVLDDAVISVFKVAFTSPAGTPLTTLMAGTASAGAQDAALIALAGAVVTDTVTVGAELHVGLDDGSGRVLMILDESGDFDSTLFGVGKTVAGNGVLVPTGTGSWVFKPRAAADLTIS